MEQLFVSKSSLIYQLLINSLKRDFFVLERFFHLKIEMYDQRSVTRMLDYLQNIWPFRTLKFAQWHLKFVKVSWKFCKIIIKLLGTKWPKFLTLCQSGEISPNLVTLDQTRRIRNLIIDVHTLRRNGRS